MSPPFSSILPPVIRAFSGSSRMSDSAIDDLPQPDSPTSPSACPLPTVKLTPSTACTGPACVSYRIDRPSTERTGRPFTAASAADARSRP